MKADRSNVSTTISHERLTPDMVTGTDIERDSGGLELIAKTNSVLDTLEHHGESSAQQIALATGEPLSSVYRLLLESRRHRMGRPRFTTRRLSTRPVAHDDRRPARRQGRHQRSRSAGPSPATPGNESDQFPVCTPRSPSRLYRAAGGACGAVFGNAVGEFPPAVLRRCPTRHSSRSFLRYLNSTLPCGTSDRRWTKRRPRYCGPSIPIWPSFIRADTRFPTEDVTPGDRSAGSSGLQPSRRGGGRDLDQRSSVADPR